jgi:hypothetical protein
MGACEEKWTAAVLPILTNEVLAASKHADGLISAFGSVCNKRYA